MMRYDSVIFDLDGVLIDNSEGIFHCIEHTVKKLGLSEPDEQTKRGFIGPSLKYSFTRVYGMNEEEAWQAVRTYREEYVAVGVKLYKLYPGVKETLKELFDTGVKISLSTGKVLSSAEFILSDSGVRGYFEKVCAFDSSPDSSDKSALIRGAVSGKSPLMVGDRIFDIESSAKAGVPVCFARYGFGQNDDLSGYSPQYFIDDISELPLIVKNR